MKQNATIEALLYNREAALMDKLEKSYSGTLDARLLEVRLLKNRLKELQQLKTESAQPEIKPEKTDQHQISSGWRKRQISGKDPDEIIRNRTLEEVAQKFDTMRSFGDTAQSFSIFVRGMKT